MDRSLDEIIGERPARGVSARFRLPKPRSLLQLANRHHSAAEAEEAGHEDAATAIVASDVQAHHPPERHGEKSIHEMVYERYVADEAIDEQGRSCDFSYLWSDIPFPRCSLLLLPNLHDDRIDGAFFGLGDPRERSSTTYLSHPSTELTRAFGLIVPARRAYKFGLVLQLRLQIAKAIR